jgi:hypothetical protein
MRQAAIPSRKSRPNLLSQKARAMGKPVFMGFLELEMKENRIKYG